MKTFWIIYIALFVIGAWLAVYLVIFQKNEILRSSVAALTTAVCIASILLL